MGHLLGYARVSTTDQHPQLQVDALERAGCYRVFTETASGARADRPARPRDRVPQPPGGNRHHHPGGRPSVLTAHKLQVARELYASGQYTVARIAKTLGQPGLDLPPLS